MILSQWSQRYCFKLVKDNILPIIVHLRICWTSLAHKYMYGHVFTHTYNIFMDNIYDIFMGILSKTHTHTYRYSIIIKKIYIYIYIWNSVYRYGILPPPRHFSRGVSPSRIDASSLWWGRPTERPSEGEAKETFRKRGDIWKGGKAIPNP